MYKKSVWPAFPRRWSSVLLCVLMLCQACLPPAALAYTRSSPEVTQMLEKAIGFLEGSAEDRLGGQCAIATVFLKHGYEPSHPKIREAIDACREVTRQSFNQVMQDGIVVYQVALALIFLVELDAQQYRSEIEMILRWLLSMQKEHGGWGYPPHNKLHGATGDTSMTQYAVLGCWMAKQAKFQVSRDTFQRALGWLVRTQDPSGCWGYQGVDSGSLTGPRVTQDLDRTSLSLAAAGLGSVYMCANVLNINASAGPKPDSATGSKLPAALKLVEENPSSVRGSVQAVPRLTKAAKASMQDGDKWLEENFSASTSRYQYYYLYALERYQSFRELVLRQSDPEPEWYHAGVKLLRENQNENGSWIGGCGDSVSTALACLFLKRSTKTAINKRSFEFGGGRLTGGRGLPKNLTNVRLHKGKIVNVTTESHTTVADIVLALENPSNPDFQKLMENPDQFVWDSIPAGGRAVNTLRQIVKSGEPKERRMSIIALGKQRNLDNAPAFIYGLSDPDNEVSIASRNALRFVSRRFDGFGMPDVPQTSDKRAAVQSWKAWLLKVRPDVKLWK